MNLSKKKIAIVAFLAVWSTFLFNMVARLVGGRGA